MAVLTYDQALAAPVVTKVITRIKTPNARFQEWWGVQPGGPNVNQYGGHMVQWDIMDRVRRVARARAPGSGPSTIALRPIGIQTAQMCRFHEKTVLLDERLFRRRALGGRWGEIDERGQRYLAAQQRDLAQRFRNAREFMFGMMLQGGFDLKFDGEDLIPVKEGSGDLTIDYQIPAGNKNQLDMLGAGNIIGAKWSDAATDIIADCLAINAANEQLHGFPLRHAWCNSTTIQYLSANTGLKNAAGTSNVMWTRWDRFPGRSVEGWPDTGFEVVFKGLPWIVWHVYDAGLDTTTASAFEKLIADHVVLLSPDPDPAISEMAEGSEIVRENRLSEGDERFGMTAWTEPITQPAGFELISLDNVLPLLYIPKAIQVATVHW